MPRLLTLLLLAPAGAVTLGRQLPAVPAVALRPEGRLPAVMCGMGGQLLGQLGPVGRVITTWLSLGGRGLDAAQVYQTEPAVPTALEAAGVPREQAFILTKIDPIITGLPLSPALVPEVIRSAVEYSLKRLQVAYLDMMLIHEHGPNDLAVWQALEALHDEGKLKAIGVSNFEVHHMEALMRHSKVPIALNQRMMSVVHTDEEVLSFCRSHGIVYQAYSPLGWGSDNILHDPTVNRIAMAHNRSAAQVALRWILEKGAVLTVQSESEQHQQENMQLFDWSLTPADMAALAGLSVESR